MKIKIRYYFTALDSTERDGESYIKEVFANTALINQ
jgi:hypothetical protein